MGVSSALGSSALLPAGFGFRNVLINGAMQVAQRGTSTAGITATGYYTADRWRIALTGLGTWTQSVENDAPTGSGFRKSLKMLCTTADASPAASDFLIFQQNLEGQNVQQFAKGTASAKQFSVSFWVKANVTGTYIAELVDNGNTRQVSKSYTINATNTWEYKTVLFPADTIGAFANDNSSQLQLNFNLGSGTDRTSGTLNTVWGSTVQANRAVGQVNLAAATNNYWQITGVQLEANVQPTPFEHRPIGVELALCQRYYWRTGQTAFMPAWLGAAINTTQLVGSISFPVSMRTSPVLATGGSAMTYTILPDRYSTDQAMFYVSSSGFTSGYAYRIYGDANGTSFVEFRAEL